MPDDELTLQVLRRINRTENQKSLAEQLGISVGKVNYILKALIDKGFIKAVKFVRSDKKRAYTYLLTPEGTKAKLELIERFVEIKKWEYEELLAELESSRREIEG